MHRVTTFLILFCAATHIQSQKTSFRVIREWKYLNFTWESEDHLRKAIAQGHYVPENNIMAGISYYEGYYYLGLPRMRDGVPATLTRIKDSGEDTRPPLEPYPSWKMNELNDCDSLQNVQNVEVDVGGKMWIIDGGRTSTMAQVPIIKCPPKLLIHDINENKTLFRYNFPEDVAKRETAFLYDLVIDDYDGGYAYITDNSRSDPGIIVFSLKAMDSWKIRHNDSMKAQLNATFFQVDGVSISAPINLAGIALGPQDPETGDRLVYFNPLSSFRLYSINSAALREKSFTNHTDYIKDLGPRTSQTDGMIMDDKGVLYFGLLGSSSLAKWNSSTTFINNQELISKDPVYIQWPNTFTFNNKGDIIVLTNRLHKYIYGQMDLNEDNFRLLASKVGSNSYLFDKLKYIIDEKTTTETTPMSSTTTNTKSNSTTTPKIETTMPTTTTTEYNHIHFHMITESTNSSTNGTTPASTTTQKPRTMKASSSQNIVYSSTLITVCLVILFR